MTAWTGWRTYRFPGNRTQRIKGLENAFNSHPNRSELMRQLQNSRPASAQQPAGPAFLIRGFGMGQVVAIQADEPFAPGPFSIAHLFNELGRENWMWYQRFGFSMHRDNDNY